MCYVNMSTDKNKIENENVSKVIGQILFLNFLLIQDILMGVFIKCHTIFPSYSNLFFCYRYTFGCRQAVLKGGDRSILRINMKDAEPQMMTLYSRNGATVGIVRASIASLCMCLTRVP